MSSSSFCSYTRNTKTKNKLKTQFCEWEIRNLSTDAKKFNKIVMITKSKIFNFNFDEFINSFFFNRKWKEEVSISIWMWFIHFISSILSIMYFISINFTGERNTSFDWTVALRWKHQWGFILLLPFARLRIKYFSHFANTLVVWISCNQSNDKRS